MMFTLSTMMFTLSTMMFTLLPLFMAFTFVASSSYCDIDKELEAIKAKIENCKATENSHVVALQRQLDSLNTKMDNSLLVKSDVRKLQSDFDALKAKTALLDQHVYFLATFQSLTPTIPVGTVVFDRVLANTGNGYNPSDGIFTAPRDGLYVFTVQAFNRDSDVIDWNLHVNGRMVLRERSYTKNANNNYVYPVILKSGDSVSVNNRNVINIWGTDQSVMAGWLIKAL